MTNVHPKLVIYVIYRSKNGYWRGFCSPYDVSTEAKTSEEAKIQLEKQVDLYVEGLKKYNYPEHLSIKALSDKEDQVIFSKALKGVSSDIKKKLFDKYLEFQARKEREEVQIKGNSLSINYFQPCFA